MKLSKYDKELGVDYRTAWNWFKSGKIEGAYQTPTGTVIVPDIKNEQSKTYGVILYARTSSSQNKDLLDNQVKRLEDYAAAKEHKKEYDKEYRKEYFKEYRRKHKEYYKEYYRKNKEKIKEYKKEYYLKHKK